MRRRIKAAQRAVRNNSRVGCVGVDPPRKVASARRLIHAESQVSVADGTALWPASRSSSGAHRQRPRMGSARRRAATTYRHVDKMRQSRRPDPDARDHPGREGSPRRVRCGNSLRPSTDCALALLPIGRTPRAATAGSLPGNAVYLFARAWLCRRGLAARLTSSTRSCTAPPGLAPPPDLARRAARGVVTGSHLDSVPDGGAYEVCRSASLCRRWWYDRPRRARAAAGSLSSRSPPSSPHRRGRPLRCRLRRVLRLLPALVAFFTSPG